MNKLQNWTLVAAVAASVFLGIYDNKKDIDNHDTQSNNHDVQRNTALELLAQDAIEIHTRINDGNIRRYGIWTRVDKDSIDAQYTHVSADLSMLHLRLRAHGLEDIAEQTADLKCYIDTKRGDAQSLYRKDTRATRKYQEMADDIRIGIENNISHHQPSILDIYADNIIDFLRKDHWKKIGILSISSALFYLIVRSRKGRQIPQKR